MLLSLPEEVIVHKKLALTVLHEKNGINRAYAIWSVLRHNERGWFNFQDVLETIQDLTRVDDWTVRRWLKAGEGKFWTISNNRIWLLGKKKVFDIFNISLNQNGALVVPASDLLVNSIQRLKATLHFTWIDKREIRACHGTITKITGTSSQTQLNYSKVIKIKVQRSSYEDEEGTKWGSNKYFCRYWRKYLSIRKNKFGWQTQGNKTAKSGQDNLDLSLLDYSKRKMPTKMYFDSIEKASKVAAKRAKLGIELDCYGLIKNGNVAIYKRFPCVSQNFGE